MAMFDFIKGKGNSTLNNSSKPELTKEKFMDREEFIDLFFESLFLRVARDFLQKYEIQEDNYMLFGSQKVWEKNISQSQTWNMLSTQITTMYCIFAKVMFSPQSVVKAKLGNVYFFKSYNLNMGKDAIEKSLKTIDDRIEVEQVYYFAEPYFHRESLKISLYPLYSYFVQNEVLKNKIGTIVFKKYGLDELGKDENRAFNLEELKNDVYEQIKGINNANWVAIGEKSSIETLGMSMRAPSSLIDDTINNVAILTGIPAGILKGEISTGLGGTGIADFYKVQYDRMVDFFRKNYIEPFLKSFQLEFKYVTLSDEQKIQLLNEFGANAVKLKEADKDLFEFYKKTVKNLLK